MKKLQILRVDHDLVQKADLQIGNNIIGGNVVTGCEDDRVIKHAVTINLSSDNEMTITPVAPCYMKSSESPRWHLLKLGTTVPIKPGDVCSLVPFKCWFKIILVSDTMEASPEHSSKRKASEGIDLSVTDKKPCLQSGEGDNAHSPNNVLKDMLNNNNDIIKVKVDGNMDEHNAIETDNASSKGEGNMHEVDSKPTSESPNVQRSSGLEQHAHGLGDTNEAGEEAAKDLQSTSGADEPVVTKVDPKNPEQRDQPNVSSDMPANAAKRDKCIYGTKCYRRNLQHKVNYSHPGDSDYDIPDDREECPYGTKCYRKNPQHKMQFKHTGTNQRNKRRRKQMPAKAIETVDLSDIEDSLGEESAEESVDESEYTPSSDEESSDEDEAEAEAYSDKNENDSDEEDADE